MKRGKFVVEQVHSSFSIVSLHRLGKTSKLKMLLVNLTDMWGNANKIASQSCKEAKKEAMTRI